jgi:predicted kinase
MTYVVYLVGFAGTGKLTIATELALRIDARVVDNQWVNNPIFGLVQTDGVTPLPTAIWAQVDKVIAEVERSD